MLLLQTTNKLDDALPIIRAYLKEHAASAPAHELLGATLVLKGQVELHTEHYAVTGPDGAFALDGIPPGTYPIVAWQADGDLYQGQVEVRAGKTTTFDIELREERWPQDRHTRKDGTPYGRYK